MSATESITGAFAQLHPGVQKQLWAMGWTELRPIQVEAIGAIMASSAPVILSAATASGKTEAAFLPALSKIADEPTGSVRILYISPLKALINDQFMRVEDLCSRLEMPVHRWHGDVAQAKKHAVLKEPRGVLLITPESLESLFVNHGGALTRLFSGLRYVVLDELHAFLDNCRGQHLRSLLRRLSAYPQEPATLIGLSATLGDFSAAKSFLSRKDPDSVRLIIDKAGGREIQLKIHGYRGRELPPAIQAATKDLDPEILAEYAAELAMGVDILRHAAGNTALVFAGSKALVELTADLCSRLAPTLASNASVYVHHGSLSAEIREDTEDALKSGRPVITFCSSTLEMGIDIAAVRMVGQIGPSWSVASQRQRLGRSGRKEGEPSILRIYVDCPATNERSAIIARLQPELIQSIAVTELMLEKWIEPARMPSDDYSTLAHQVISVIAQTGGIRADALHRRLSVDGAFPEVDAKSFGILLRELGARDVVEQTVEGDLILGLRGEVLRKSRDFYAVFPTPEEYDLQHAGRSIGKLTLVPEKDSHLVFAGKRWRVAVIDLERKIIQLTPARGRGKPLFSGHGGDVHPEIRKRMRQLLEREDQPAFLDQQAAEALAEARRAYREADLGQRILFPMGERRCCLFTWAGSRVHRTIGALIRRAGLDTVDFGIAWLVDASVAEIDDAFVQALQGDLHVDELAELILQETEKPKYFWLLGDALGLRQLGAQVLDLPDFHAWVDQNRPQDRVLTRSDRQQPPQNSPRDV